MKRQIAFVLYDSYYMKNMLRIVLIILMCLFLFGVTGLAVEPNSPEVGQKEARAAVIVCKGMIDDGLFRSIKRRTTISLDGGATYLIYEIGTYGGFLDAADNISKYLILDIGKKVRTVAYITSEAISAGAMISVSCQDIIMRENTTIGDCAPISIGSKLEGVEREKAESFVRAAFMRAAEANGYPAALLKAMVSMQTEVYRVKNLQSGGYEFFEGGQLPTDANLYELEKKEVIDKSDELLALTASKASEYGIARAQVKDLRGALDFLAKRDGVTFVGEPVVLKPNWSEQMVRWLNSPAVMAVLVMLALLGVYVEFNTPGLGLPGLVAAICFALIIGSKYLVGMANWVEVALFGIGILLLIIEIFVLPGFGISGILGIICILVGIFGMLIRNSPDTLPWPHSDFDWHIFTTGVLGLSLGFVGFIVLAWLLGKHLPRLQFLSGLILVPGMVRQGGEVQVSMTTSPESKGLCVNVGDAGVAVSTLRPAGKAKFGDAVVDVVAEAAFVETGNKVIITEIHGNRVVVKVEN